jgi:hypothetical protein
VGEGDLKEDGMKTRSELMKNFHNIPNQDHTQIKNIILVLIDEVCDLREKLDKIEHDANIPTRMG